MIVTHDFQDFLSKALGPLRVEAQSLGYVFVNQRGLKPGPMMGVVGVRVAEIVSLPEGRPGVFEEVCRVGVPLFAREVLGQSWRFKGALA